MVIIANFKIISTINTQSISKIYLIIGFILLLNCNRSKEQQSLNGWTSLFNGKDLSGWNQLNGTAKFNVQDGVIVGTTITNTPNSFLCTNKHYDNFILEFEVLVDSVINSGVQFRSNSFKSYRNGQVHGYQFELDPSTRAFSGGIYDEGRRAWIYPLSVNPNRIKSFKNGKWNKCRIEAIDNSIKTWINGVQCANLIDDLTKSGFIALQVHGIGSNEAHAGKKIKWKNIRIKTSNLKDEAWTPDPAIREISFLKNELTPNEKLNGWQLLWDGKSSSGWKGATLNHFPNFGWHIKNGELIIKDTINSESQRPGDIITQKTYDNFELELEFKITKGANSGIKYFVNPQLIKESGNVIGYEFQILDDKNHPDKHLGINNNRTLASLYDIIPADNLSVPGRGKQFKGINTWNKARIVVNGTLVEHWLNNEKALEYDKSSQSFKNLVSKSKFKDYSAFINWLNGHILLQDHGGTVHFRSIKIREFKE